MIHQPSPGLPRTQLLADSPDASRRHARGEQRTLPLLRSPAGEHRLELRDQRLPVQNTQLVRRITLVHCEVGPPDRQAEFRVEAVVRRSHGDPAVGGAKRLVGDDARVCVPVPPRLFSCEQCVGADVDKRCEGGVEKRDLDAVPLPGNVSSMKRSENRRGRIEAGQHVDNRHTDLHRFAVGLTRDRHQAALGLNGEVVTGPVARLP